MISLRNRTANGRRSGFHHRIIVGTGIDGRLRDVEKVGGGIDAEFGLGRKPGGNGGLELADRNAASDQQGRLILKRRRLLKPRVNRDGPLERPICLLVFPAEAGELREGALATVQVLDPEFFAAAEPGY